MTPRANGARQVRLACAKPQTSREVDQDPEGGLTRQCNARPSFLIMCCVPHEQRQYENHYHKTTTAGTFHNVYEVDGIWGVKGDAEQRIRQALSHLSRHNLVKTRSVKTRFYQDTFQDVCFCIIPNVNFSGDRVRGARFSRHLHGALFSDRVRGAHTWCLLCRTSDSD